METAAYDYLAILALASIIFVCLVVFIFFLVQLLRKDDPRDHPRSDLTDMMILFQTMRDVVSEQKALAREFNASLDRKVEAIRGLVAAAQEEREELRKSQRAISQLLHEAKDELLGGERGGGPRQRARAAALDDIGDGLKRIEEDATPEPALRGLGGDAEAPDPVDDLIDSWAGAEFVAPEAAPQPPRPAPEAPTAPEDAAAARDAFRTLLDFESEPRATAAPQPKSTPERAARTEGGNGKPPLSPLQRRVYEYSDAGMKVSEIAKELGIGKGEIRLIQSLRKDKERI